MSAKGKEIHEEKRASAINSLNGGGQSNSVKSEGGVEGVHDGRGQVMGSLVTGRPDAGENAVDKRREQHSAQPARSQSNRKENDDDDDESEGGGAAEQNKLLKDILREAFGTDVKVRGEGGREGQGVREEERVKEKELAEFFMYFIRLVTLKFY